MSAGGSSPEPGGICQAVIASTTAPVSLAWWIAQRSAAVDDSKPSIPTTMRAVSPFTSTFSCHDGVDRFPGGVRIEVPTAPGVRAHVRPELVQQRDSGGDVQSGDLIVRYRF